MTANSALLGSDDTEALRAAILNLPALTALKAEHEQQAALALEEMAMSTLQDAFRLGYALGQQSKES
jgi:hypothetical protein